MPVVAPLLEELGLEAEHDLVVVAGPHGEDCFICLNVFSFIICVIHDSE